VNARKINWPLWLGFLLSVFAFLSYPLVFVRLPATRDFPWANLLLFAVSAILLFRGLRRSFSPERSRGAKIVGAIVSVLGAGIFAFFIFGVFIFARQLPASQGAPQVGQKAPEFTLSDTDNKPVSLAELTSAPIKGKAPKGVLLIFYRGYW
jgi:ABC-type transport system involved in cytochrome c biogenesis permease subunit